MLKDVTLGQFFPGSSIVHRLDPRCKLLLTIVYIAALFTAESYVSYAVMLIITGVCIALSRIPLKVILRGLKPLWIIIALTAVLNIFFTPGRELVSFWKITITYEGLVRAVFMVLRITMLIAGTFLLTYTTSPIALTDAMEILFGPLKKLKVPVHEMSMMMSMALRFIPTLIEETDKIMSAQKARGADFETGNLFQRARALLPLLVPLVSAMRAGLAVGMVNGIGVAIGDLPPFIMTLGSMTAVRGLALLTSNGKPITGISKGYKAVAASSIAGIPMLSIFLVIVIIICAFVLSKTVYGRRVYACGGNLQAARVSGINTTAIRISTFAIAGLLAGLCGFLMTSRVTIGQPTAAESYEMDAITACVVGGVSMTGGVGKPWGVVIGCLLITVIANGLDIMGVSSHWQKIVKGVIIVVAVLIDVKGKTKKN